jgi:hypothetical protein
VGHRLTISFLLFFATITLSQSFPGSNMSLDLVVLQ